MSVKHTPTPWISHFIGDMSPTEIRDLDEPTVTICGDYRVTVASARGYDLHESDKEDAAFIVRACNNHDALVAGLTDALRILDAVRLSAGLGKGQIDRMDKAREALRLAKGDQSNG